MTRLFRFVGANIDVSHDFCLDKMQIAKLLNPLYQKKENAENSL